MNLTCPVFISGSLETNPCNYIILQMKAALLLLLFTSSVMAAPLDLWTREEISPKVIYGVDNRREIYEAPGVFKQLAKSTVTLVRSDQIVEGAKANHFKLIGPSFWAKEDLCEDEPYREQKMVAHCSGFLVAPDIVATAGHCIRDTQHCQTLAYVFDVEMKDQNFDYQIPKDNFYSCKELIAKVEDSSSKIDYALVRLNKKVTGRSPLKYRKTGKPSQGAEMAVIGHPYGIPKKFTDNGFIIHNDNPSYFTADLDTYSYNSGSPVFNVNTREVEGILVRGEVDFEFNEAEKCNRSRICNSSNCNGEEVTRMPLISIPN